MASQSQILKADVGRASSVAWALLCILAVAQVILVVRHAVTQDSSRIRATPAPVDSRPSTTAVPEPGQLQIVTPPSAAVSAAISPPAPGSLMADAPAVPGFSPVPAPSGPPAVGSLALTGSPAAPAPSIAALAPAQAPSVAAVAPAPAPSQALGARPGITPPVSPAVLAPISKVDEFIRIAREVRDLGDTQGALETLRRADLEVPDEPAIIAETAETYAMMGLADKAQASWKQIVTLGAEKGGRHYVLASRKLSGLDTPSAASSSSSPSTEPSDFILPTIDQNRSLRLGTCLISRDTSVNVGERYVLRVPIITESREPIDTQKVDIDVFFFDRVNGQKVELTIADEPVSTWIAPPVDWAGSGEELLDIVYHLPLLSETEIQAHGRRSYHGYVVKLYYQHRLQDVAAAPDDLLDFASPQPQMAGPENTLLPPVPQ